MHRTHDGERYPLSAHGLKCPRLVHKIREVLVERLEAENMVLYSSSAVPKFLAKLQ
jgi:hypothetical protein